MSERDWNIHAPNVEARKCAYCGEEFYPEHQSNKYCEKHRSNKYSARTKKGISDTKQIRCRECGSVFEVTVEKGSSPVLCEECRRRPKPVGPDEVGARSWLMLGGSSADRVLFSSQMDIARMPSTWDDEYAQIEWLAREDQETIMRDLNNHEVVYARSVTERHQHPFLVLRLIVAVENVSERNREREMYWAHAKLKEMIE